MIKQFLTALLLLHAVSSTAAQDTQCQSDDSPKLKFVAQLSVRGSPVFVHDTGAPDGPHLAVEPLMFVEEEFGKLFARNDSFLDQTYVSIAVKIRDDTLLGEIRRQLRHLAPKSVTFANVSGLRIYDDPFSTFPSLDFIWNPGEPVGYLKLGASNYKSYAYCGQEIPINLRLSGIHPASLDSIVCSMHLTRGKGLSTNTKIDSRQKEATSLAVHWVLSNINITADIEVNGTVSRFNYHPILRYYSFLNPEIYTNRYASPKPCSQLQFVRSIRFANCTARVHQRRDMKGQFFIEPLLCHNVTMMSNFSLMYDPNSGSKYLMLVIILQDDDILQAVKTQLADLSPREVSFLTLWRAPITASLQLRSLRDVELSQLAVVSDGYTGILKLYCRSDDACNLMRSTLLNQPEVFWARVDTRLTSIMPDGSCIVNSPILTHFSNRPRQKEVPNAELWLGSNQRAIRNIVLTEDGRSFVVIQQRVRGHVNFQRSWQEYETGFGDETDFWIGLSAISALSSYKKRVRIEMKLWNYTDLYAEYDGFRISDSKYALDRTLVILRNMSNIEFDAFQFVGGSGPVRFSSNDRDNDLSTASACSSRFGQAGWWFADCTNFNPNGVYGGGASEADMTWSAAAGSRQALKEVRIMLQVS